MGARVTQIPSEIVGTRERLLEAAGEVFAERGFRDATVRDICARAGANVAAVNYHFGDKEGLYMAALEQCRMHSMALSSADFGASAPGTPEDRLAAFVRQFVMRLLDRGRPTWHAKLISREMIEPTAALDMLIERSIGPQWRAITSIVGEMLGRPADDMAVVMCAASVVGQCLHHHHCREVTLRLLPGVMDQPGVIEALVKHITEFSIAGVRGRAGSVGRESVREGEPCPTPAPHDTSGPAGGGGAA